MGISQSYISKIENGDCIPSEEVIKKYCKTFHLSRKAIMLFSKEANSKKDITNQQILLIKGIKIFRFSFINNVNESYLSLLKF